MKGRGRSGIFPIFPVINPPRFLQGGFALFNKTVRPAILLMKYRLAYDRGLVCPVFRLHTARSAVQIMRAGLSFTVDPIVER